MCRERINRFDRQETGKSDEADVVLRTKRGGDRKYIAKIAHPRHPSWVARGGVVGERWSCDSFDGTNRALTMGVVCRRSGAGYGSHPWSHGDGQRRNKGRLDDSRGEARSHATLERLPSRIVRPTRLWNTFCPSSSSKPCTELQCSPCCISPGIAFFPAAVTGVRFAGRPRHSPMVGCDEV